MREIPVNVDAPILPSILFAGDAKETVVVLPRLIDVAAQVEDRNLKEPFTDEHENIENPPGPSVSIVRRVNARQSQQPLRVIEAARPFPS